MGDRIDVYKLTTDDWYPSFLLGCEMLVRVSLIDLPSYGSAPENWRVCVWGDDDCGMEQDFDDVELAGECFQDVIKQEYVNRDYLTEMEFVRA